MDYNTRRESLVLPEYGRNVQQMVDSLLQIEDRARRTAQAKVVIRVMLALAPHLRSQEDCERRLWDHLHVMSGFRLEVDGPYPAPVPADMVRHPQRMEYPARTVRSDHYGSLAPRMLEALAELAAKEGVNPAEQLRRVANQMKRSYLQWNRNSVTDQEILNDLRRMSGDRLSLPDDTRLLDLQELAASRPASRAKSQPASAVKVVRKKRRKHRTSGAE